MKTSELSQILYEKDYLLWLETTLRQLKERNLSDVDWENLIEEIDSMGKSEKQVVESLLIVLLVHLMKLAYWESERDYNSQHWITEIATFRVQIKRKLGHSPSLKRYLSQIFEDCYQDAREIVTRKTIIEPSLISLAPFLTLEQTLDQDWFPLQKDKLTN